MVHKFNMYDATERHWLFATSHNVLTQLATFLPPDYPNPYSPRTEILQPPQPLVRGTLYKKTYRSQSTGLRNSETPCHYWDHLENSVSDTNQKGRLPCPYVLFSVKKSTRNSNITILVCAGLEKISFISWIYHTYHRRGTSMIITFIELLSAECITWLSILKAPLVGGNSDQGISNCECNVHQAMQSSRDYTSSINHLYPLKCYISRQRALSWCL